MLRSLFIFLLLICVGLAFWVVARTVWLIHLSQGLQEGALSFSQLPSTPRQSFLILGDSTAFGTGATDKRESVAGRLGSEFPHARIENRSANGKRTKALAEELKKSSLETFDLIVIHIGANDIIRFTDLLELQVSIATVLDEAKKRSQHVVLLTAGDVGEAPFFPPLLNRLWSERTVVVRDMFKSMAENKDVAYVDLLAAGVGKRFLSDIPRYHSPDLLHLTGDGYGIWYEEIKKTLQTKGWWSILEQNEKI